MSRVFVPDQPPGVFFNARLHMAPSRLVLATLLFMAGHGSAGAEPLRQSGSLGGGFLEMLVTGRSPGVVRASPAPVSSGVVQIVPDARRSLQVAPLPARNSVPETWTTAPPVPDHPAPARQQASAVYGQPPAANAFASPTARGAGPAAAGMDPRFNRQEVAYDGAHMPGTIIIDTPNKFLFLVQPNGRALRYGIGVGRPGFEWAGVKHITNKREWPDWRPPPEMLKRRPDLPRYMAGGIENPLGARALYLGSSLYRIHGTNEPQTIGRAVSSGCIRMRNEDVTDLYERVKVGTKVIVI
jgi:lipoprotein-anchoring transpeptidase ErfK/SrfK